MDGTPIGATCSAKVSLKPITTMTLLLEKARTLGNFVQIIVVDHDFISRGGVRAFKESWLSSIPLSYFLFRVCCVRRQTDLMARHALGTYAR